MALRYRWVQCQLETLATQNTANEIYATLRNVPGTLEQTYRSRLASIRKSDINLTKEIFLWLSFSLHPMTFAQICEAVIIGEDENMAVNGRNRLLRPKALLNSCGSLISVNSATTKVTLAHSSVRDYLISPSIRLSDVNEFYVDSLSADAAIATRCIKYLSQPAFNSGYCDTNDLYQRIVDWPLLSYISDTLFDHLSYITLDERITTILLRFFATHSQPRGGSFGAWVQVCFPISALDIEASTPLYYAARWGLLPIVKLILAAEGTKSLEIPGGVYYSTPLHVAAWQGHTEVVRELLKAGANPREVNSNGVPGLFWAIDGGHTEVERLLRDAGATMDDDHDLMPSQYDHHNTSNPSEMHSKAGPGQVLSTGKEERSTERERKLKKKNGVW